MAHTRPLLENPIVNAIISGSVDQLRTFDKEALALNDVKLPTFKYLQQTNASAILKLAIYYGQLDVIKYIITEKKHPISHIKSDIARELAHLGYLEILQYFIRTHHVFPSTALMNIAVVANHLPIVKWLRDEKKIAFTSPYKDKDKDACTNYLIWVLRKGHLSIAKWLIKNKGFSLPQANKEINLISEAIHYKHLPILQWLVGEEDFLIIYSYSLHDNPLLLACKYGSIEMVQWLLEEKGIRPKFNGEDITCTLIFGALINNQLNILKYLLSNDFSISTMNTVPFDLLLEKNKFDIWVEQNQTLRDSNIQHSLLRYVESYPHTWPLYFQDSEFRHLLCAERYHIVWPLLLMFFPHIIANASDKKELQTWFKLLDERYNLELATTNTYFKNFFKKTIINEYEKAYRQALAILPEKYSPFANEIQHTRFPLMNHLPDDSLNLVCQFLAPRDVFYTVKWLSKKHHQLVNSDFFIACKHQQYFGEDLYHIKPDNYRNYFIKTYNQHFQHQHPNIALAIHACLTNNLSYSTNITFNVLKLYYPTAEKTYSYSCSLLYSFLINTNRMEGLRHFASSLLTLETPSLRYQNELPFIMATRLKQQDIMQRLLEKNPVLIKQKDDNDETALTWAASSGYADIVTFLLARKANLRVKRRTDKFTPLDCALLNRRREVILILLNAYKEISDFQHQIEHRMIWAATNGYLDVVQVLYHYDNQLAFERDDSKQSPLLWAAIRGHADIVEFLLQKSPKLIYCSTQRTGHQDDGKTPLDWAYQNNHTAVIQVLVRYMYKNCHTLPDIILCKISHNLKRSNFTPFLFFAASPNLTLLANNLTGMKSTSNNSLLDTIEMMLSEIMRVYNLFIRSQNNTDNFLVSLLKDSLTDWFGHDSFLSQQQDKSLQLAIPDHYWELFRNEEQKALIPDKFPSLKKAGHGSPR